MKRTSKNIIVICIIIAMIVLSYFTMTNVNAKEDIPNNDQMGTNQMQDSKMEAPMDMQGKSSGESEQNDSDTPPEMPSDNNSNVGNMSEPPAKPDGEADSNNDGVMTIQEEPQNAGGNTIEGMSEPNNKLDMGNGNFGQNKIDTMHYVLFGVEGLVATILIIYLIMSKFNKYTFKETLNGGIKILVYIILVIALTVGLVFAQIYLTNNVFSKNDMQGQMGDMQKPDEGNNSGNTEIASYSAIKEITSDTTIDEGSFSSSSEDENAVSVSGDIDVTLSNISVEKTGDSDGGDNTSFYGTNSGIIAKDGANLTLKNITVKTNADGANGVFSYGGSATTNNSSSDGTTVTISDSTITTTKDNSGGIMTTGGGIMNASNLIINTAGTSSAAIRSDRGGGTVNVDGGTYTTTGQGSPTVYSTADITVKNSTLISKVSEGIVIEGKNTVTIENCDLTDSNTKLNGQSTTYKNIFLYQSMSGDASTGTSTFTANNSKITTNNGDTFYITNTTATINLTNNTIVNNDTEGNFLRAKADSWGNSGSNGGDVTLNMTNQKAEGNIVIDSVSKLAMTMQNSSYYEGTINGDHSANSITLSLDSSSSIKLTGDSYVTSLEDIDSTYSNIDLNGYTLYVNGTALAK